MDAVCQFCCKVYANRGSLTRHLAEKHNVQNVISYDISVYGFKCLENECNRSFKVNKNLIEHLRIEHNVDMREEVHQFDDYEGFRQWLNQMHSHENVEYIQHRGPKIKEDCEILYFNCSRSEIQHLHIPKMEKAIIARNLVNGVPITRILDNNRESFCEDKIKRINLLTRKDVHNVKDSFNIHIQEGVRHSEDATSVALFVEECRQLENNPILFYKSQGKEHPQLEALSNFAHYFRANYYHNYKKWAYCYRKNLGINTNMRLESMHKTLKYFYLDGKKVKRLDKGLFALNKFIRDKVVERIIKRVKGKNNFHIKEINKRHRRAQNDTFKMNHLVTNTWKIQSDNDIYEVKSVAISPCCNLKCDLCGICVHNFTCTCVDFFVHNTICKHIHYVSLHSTTNILMESECEDTKQINENEIGTHLSTLSQSIPPSNDNKKKLLDTIFSETEKLNTQAASSNDLQVLNHVLSTLKKENMIIKKTQNHEQINAFASSSKSEPANKNIPKQVNFCSTKKRKVSKKQFLQRPSIAERNVILNKT